MTDVGVTSLAAGISGARKKKEKKVRRWWSSIDTECPISLARIGDLQEPPFVLATEGSAAKHYFDARFLANFLVSSLDFIDPVNRRELTREECRELDDFMADHHWDVNISVTDAFD